MNTNDPGREPEPTDAELAAVLDLFDAVKEWGSEEISSGDMMTEAEHRLAKAFRCISLATIARLRVAELSGAQPMPDTPAPDEVAQLRAEVARLKEGLLRETHAYEQVCIGAKKLQDAADVSEARIADLERENAALGAERDRLKESCRIVLGFGKAIISDASINGVLDGAPTTLLFQTVDEEHTIGMDATGYGRDNLEPGDGNVQIVFTKAESVDVVIDTLVKIKGAIEAAVSPGKEAPDA